MTVAKSPVEYDDSRYRPTGSTAATVSALTALERDPLYLEPSSEDYFRLRVDDGSENGRRWLSAFSSRRLPQSMYRGDSVTLPMTSVTQSIGTQSSPQYEERGAFMAHSPTLVFGGVSARSTSVVLHLRADELNDYDASETAAAWFESLSRPFYDSAGLRWAPPPVLISCGAVVSMRAIVESVTASYVGPWTPVADTYRCLGVDVRLDLSSVSQGFVNHRQDYRGTYR